MFVWLKRFFWVIIIVAYLVLYFGPDSLINTSFVTVLLAVIGLVVVTVWAEIRKMRSSRATKKDTS